MRCPLHLIPSFLSFRGCLGSSLCVRVCLSCLGSALRAGGALHHGLHPATLALRGPQTEQADSVLILPKLRGT